MKESKSFQTYEVQPDKQGLTAEEYVKIVLNISGRKIQRLTRQKGILLNDRPVFLQKKIRAGDKIKVLMLSAQSYGVSPEPGAIEILFEDERMIVLNKPRDCWCTRGTNRSWHACQLFGLLLRAKRQGLHGQTIHRLDRDTTGCVAFAKDSGTQTVLEKQLKDGSFKRTYLAIVQGVMDPPAGTIDVPIGEHPAKPNRRAITGQGERAVTHYRAVFSSREMSLLEITLETGRTHQIRVHLAWAGHPVIGDRMYGKSSPLISRQALHAQSMEFIHPGDGGRKKVKAPFPSDFQAVLNYCKNLGSV